MNSNIDDLLGDDSPNEFTEPPAAVAIVNPANIPLEKLLDSDELQKFLATTMAAPFDAIDSLAVSQGYAAAVWQFRAAALSGNYKIAKALQIWLEWAQKINSRPVRAPMENINNESSKAFLPREVKEEQK